jgi:hypothetical protein
VSVRRSRTAGREVHHAPRFLGRVRARCRRCARSDLGRRARSTRPVTLPAPPNIDRGTYLPADSDPQGQAPGARACPSLCAQIGPGPCCQGRAQSHPATSRDQGPTVRLRSRSRVLVPGRQATVEATVSRPRPRPVTYGREPRTTGRQATGRLRVWARVDGWRQARRAQGPACRRELVRRACYT